MNASSTTLPERIDRFSQVERIDQLRRQIQAVETAGVVDDGQRISNGSAAIDGLLPQSGYRRGTLVDWIAPTGCAADFLSLMVAREACRNGGALVVIDPDRQFFPVAAAAMGLNLDQMIVLQEKRGAGYFLGDGENASTSSTKGWSGISEDLLWSIEQSLRCEAVAAVWGPLPSVDDRWLRRFQLAAETSGCMGLFQRPPSVARDPGWADVQWRVSPANRTPERVARQEANVFSMRLQLTRCRTIPAGKSILLSINTVTGSVQRARSDDAIQTRPARSARPALSATAQRPPVEHPQLRRHNQVRNRERCKTGFQCNGSPSSSPSLATPPHPVPVVAGVAGPAAGRRQA